MLQLIDFEWCWRTNLTHPFKDAPADEFIEGSLELAINDYTEFDFGVEKEENEESKSVPSSEIKLVKIHLASADANISV